MFSNLEFGLKLATIGIPLVFLSLGVIAVFFELIKRKFRVEEKVKEEKSFEKELAAAIIAAIYAATTLPKETFKLQKTGLNIEWKSTPIWNLAGRLELTSKK
ncbi:MAG: hypothetical protein QW476_01660 [Candidatus Bathyarchaeia archaeon]